MMDKERGTVEALFCDFESLNFEMCKRERTIEEFENYEDGAWEQRKCNGRFLASWAPHFLAFCLRYKS